MRVTTPQFVQHFHNAAFTRQRVIQLLGKVAAHQRTAALKILAGIPLAHGKGLAAVHIANFYNRKRVVRHLDRGGYFIGTYQRVKGQNLRVVINLIQRPQCFFFNLYRVAPV